MVARKRNSDSQSNTHLARLKASNWSLPILQRTIWRLAATRDSIDFSFKIVSCTLTGTAEDLKVLGEIWN